MDIGSALGGAAVVSREASDELNAERGRTLGKPLLVAVVSRHQLTRAGLTRLIESDPGRVRVVTLREANQVDGLDAVVYDLAGGDVNGTGDDYLRRLLEVRVPVVAVQPGVRSPVSEQIVALGAADVLSTDVSTEQLLDSIERAAAGRCVTPGSVRDRARDSARDDAGLTERELEVLELVAAGFTNTEVAAALFVSVNTVKTYIRTAYRRIGAERRQHAVIWALERGLGPQPGAVIEERQAAGAVLSGH
jgi:DNA-binding NarL/FixJ family response regulator